MYIKYSKIEKCFNFFKMDKKMFKIDLPKMSLLTKKNVLIKNIYRDKLN